MDVSLHAWAGDNAGKVEGRQFYRVLVSLSRPIDDELIYPAFLNEKPHPEGGIYYPDIVATCLTPGASGTARVTKVDHLDGGLHSLKLKQFDVEESDKWSAGIHLFGIAVERGGQNVSAIATVIVPPKPRNPPGL